MSTRWTCEDFDLAHAEIADIDREAGKLMVLPGRWDRKRWAEIQARKMWLLRYVQAKV